MGRKSEYDIEDSSDEDTSPFVKRYEAIDNDSQSDREQEPDAVREHAIVDIVQDYEDGYDELRSDIVDTSIRHRGEYTERDDISDDALDPPSLSQLQYLDTQSTGYDGYDVSLTQFSRALVSTSLIDTLPSATPAVGSSPPSSPPSDEPDDDHAEPLSPPQQHDAVVDSSPAHLSIVSGLQSNQVPRFVLPKQAYGASSPFKQPLSDISIQEPSATTPDLRMSSKSFTSSTTTKSLTGKRSRPKKVGRFEGLFLDALRAETSNYKFWNRDLSKDRSTLVWTDSVAGMPVAKFDHEGEALITFSLIMFSDEDKKMLLLPITGWKVNADVKVDDRSAAVAEKNATTKPKKVKTQALQSAARSAATAFDEKPAKVKESKPEKTEKQKESKKEASVEATTVGKKRKAATAELDNAKTESGKGDDDDAKDSTATTSTSKQSKKKQKQQQKQQKQLLQLDEAAETTAEEKPSQVEPKQPSSDSKTVSAAKSELSSKIREKLSGSMFRIINEKLYTTTGSEAFKFISEDSESFDIYHDGFRAQVAKWPVNPVDLIIKELSALPKRITLADLGCGEARIAAALHPHKHTVHSFDLKAVNDNVVACDISHVPLPDDAGLDMAVFCLSLMGTNFMDFVREANRILKIGGTLYIAEVVSRFTNVKAFIKALEEAGFKHTQTDNTNKMFITLKFTKTAAAVQDTGKTGKGKNKQQQQQQQQQKTQKDESNSKEPLLKPCIYKRR
ncbi:hypothetical protein GQ42DRAFT_175883 [Ramicandelaber brevisporus]|nr:hypothetical protein GQ42DRAFT_175883 [Ramicandelaber brevisporus]